MRPIRFSRAAPCALAATALAIPLLAGCGGGDDERSGSPDLAVTGKAEGGKFAFSLPDKVDAGVVRVSFRNADKAPHSMQLIKVDGDHSKEEVLASGAKAGNGQPVPDWFRSAGGVGTTQPGRTASATQVLDEGSYYAIDTEAEEGREPIAQFEVSGGGDGALPSTAAKVTAREYGFTAAGLRAGKNRVRFDNAGKQWHHLAVAPLRRGKTIEDVRRFIKDQKGRSPVDDEKAIGTSIIEGGDSQVVDLELERGDYVLLCFVADRGGGPPHVVQGMASEARVE